MSLNTIASPASRDPDPLVRFVRARTGAKVDSIGFVVRRWIQCSAGDATDSRSGDVEVTIEEDQTE